MTPEQSSSMPTGESKIVTKTTLPYTFTPYKNTGLVLEKKIDLYAPLKKDVETRLLETQKTIASFTKETSIDTQVNTLFVLSADQQVLGKYGDAKKTLEKALSLGQNENLLQSYASLLMLMGSPQGGLIYINQAIQINPTASNFWRTRLDIERLLYKNDLSKLDATFVLGLQKTNNDIDMVTYYAVYLTEMKQYDKAITYWQKAMTVYPERKDMYQQEIDLLKTR